MADRRTGRTLAALVSASQSVDLDVGDLAAMAHELGERSVLHRVPGPLIQAFEELGVEVPLEVRDRQRNDALSRITALHDLAFMTEIFDAAGIEFLVFKGQVLTTLVSADHWERPTTDVDVLIHPYRLEEAVDLLVAAGALHLDRNWKMMHDIVIGELHLMLPAGTSLDLHWHLLVRDDTRHEFTPDHGELFATSRSVDLDGTPVRTFSPEHTLVYSCLHAAISGGHRLVWFKDIERLMALDGADADAIVAVAQRWRCELIVGAMLMRTDAVLGLDDGDALIERLIPSRIARRVLATVDRVRPPQHVTGDAPLLRLVTRSIRVDRRSTLTSFVRRSAANAIRVVRRRPVPTAETLFEDVPGNGLRQRYFDIVRTR